MTSRLPLPSFCQCQCFHPRVVWGVMHALHHGVCAAVHVVDGGGGAMARFGCFACGIGVVGIEPNSVHPAIEDDGAIAGCAHRLCNGNSGKGGMHRHVIVAVQHWGYRCDEGIGVLKSCLCTCEGFDVAIIFFFEMCLKVSHGLLDCQFVFPLVDGSVKNTGVFEDCEGEVHGHNISDSFSSGSCKDLAFSNALP